MKSLYSVILVLSVTFASCDFPAYINNITDVNKLFFSRTQTTKAAYSFAFATKAEDHRVKFTKGSYKWEVVEKNKPTSDTRTISYRSSSTKIAKVDNKGIVTFKAPGTVIITAEKAEKGAHESVEATYTLYITMKPRTKNKLAKEIDRAMVAHGNNVDLNYIDTSDITDMHILFSSYGHNIYNLYNLGEFAGNISKWDVSSVTIMSAMFWGAEKFNSDISKWDVSSVTSMGSMFLGATAFNSDISKWNVSSVTTMYGMFHGATSFTQNLNAWGSRLNAHIRRDEWIQTFRMFKNSGLKDSLPTWCESEPSCKSKQR